MASLMTERNVRIVSIGLALAASLASVYYWSDRWPTVGIAMKEVAIGGPFRLIGSNSEIVDTKTLKGKPFAVFFGYTRCPEACPTIMMELSQLLGEGGDAAKDFRVFFITVDPARDTPDTLREYMSNFDRRIVGLSGTEAEIADVAKLYRAFYQKVPTSSGDYTMNHTAVVYLMNDEGLASSVIGFGDPHEVALNKLKRLLDGHAAKIIDPAR